MAIKVLVVDDSALMRKHLSNIFKGAGFEVALARHGIEAVEQVTEWHPDVVTLDINMPEMDGLTALSLIMAARPTPTIMVSSLTTKGALATLEALAMGAVDFVAKPGGTISLSLDAVSAELIQKVKIAASIKLKATRVRMLEPVKVLPKASTSPNTTFAPNTSVIQKTSVAPTKSTGVIKMVNTNFGLVLIGVSTGGPRTLEDILPLLPADFPWPVLVVQHMPAAFTGPFAARLDKMCPLNVREVGHLEEVKSGFIYIARGGTDLVVGERSGRLMAISKPETAGLSWHPSVDVLVSSAMQHIKPDHLIGVQLTGMGYDGAESIAELKRRGGKTIAESEESCVVFGMPKELIARGGATLVLPANKITSQLKLWVK